MTRRIARVPPATISQPVGPCVCAISEEPSFTTRVIADRGGPPTILAQRPGADVSVEVGFGCVSIDILCGETRLRALLVRVLACLSTSSGTLACASSSLASGQTMHMVACPSMLL
eukprot:8277330-Alexandrium_andersonii.AAC.1